MFEIEDVVNTEFSKLLEQVHLGELNIFDSCKEECMRGHSKELLGMVSAPEDNTLSTLEMVLCDGRCWEPHS